MRIGGCSGGFGPSLFKSMHLPTWLVEACDLWIVDKVMECVFQGALDGGLHIMCPWSEVSRSHWVCFVRACIGILAPTKCVEILIGIGCCVHLSGRAHEIVLRIEGVGSIEMEREECVTFCAQTYNFAMSFRQA